MQRSQTFTGDEFVRRYGGDVCLMPAPTVTVAVDVWGECEPFSAAVQRMVAHLEQGKSVVLILGERNRSVGVFRDDVLPQQLAYTDTLTIPDLFPGFSVPVRRFFE